MAKKPPEKTYVPIEQVRPAVLRLEEHYGSLPQASDATGIPYKTLQGIKLEGKLTRVTEKTAERVLSADASPPKADTKGFWDKRFIATERVVPLVLFLERAYGGLQHASEVTGVSASTLRNIKSQQKDGVKRAIVSQIVEAVQKLQYGDRSFSTYENDGPPRLATAAEQGLPTNFSRWRPAGGKARVK